MFDTGSLFDSFIPSFGFGGGFQPMPVFGFRPAYTVTALPFAGALPFIDASPYTGTHPFIGPQPFMGAQPSECACGEACAAPAKDAPPAEIDEDMQKRREINAIREQMRIAAENEDFEKAAQLRDKIREMEL
jgi:hypothetical protein